MGILFVLFRSNESNWCENLKSFNRRINYNIDSFVIIIPINPWQLGHECSMFFDDLAQQPVLYLDIIWKTLTRLTQATNTDPTGTDH